MSQSTGLEGGDPPNLRRLVIGLNSEGQSAVTSIEGPLAGARRPTGNVVHELWRQDRLPAQPQPMGELTNPADIGVDAVPVVIRRLSIPPALTTAADGGESSRTESDSLHRTGSLYVGSVVRGAVHLLLEAEDVLLSEGDAFVLPDSMHSWRNPFATEAIIVSTAFPLDVEES